MNQQGQPTVIFVADSHFHLDPDPAEQQRLDRFLSLLELSRRADHLVLLGDIFEFWFDYPHFRLKGYDRILNILDEVREAGTKIHFIGGNHDIWAAGYLHQRYGSSPTGDTEILTFGDRRVLLSHGDGLLKFDWAYNSFRAVVRTRAGIVLGKALHPERQHDPDWDLMVMGHVHHGFICESGGRRLASLAGWFDPLGYALLREGNIQLLDFTNDPLPEL